MTTSPTAPVAGPEQPTVQGTRMRRFIPALVFTQLGLFTATLTPLQLLLALHLNTIAGTDARSALGMTTGLGALCGLVSIPVAGRITDRTRARLGRRRTWMFTGSLLIALMLVALSATTEVWQVVLLWCLAQVAGNFQFAANTAIVADQISPERRGGISGLVGLVAAVGPLVGIGLADAFPAGGAAQWLVVAVAAFGLTVVAVLLFRDPRSTAPKPPLNLRALAGTFWFNPRRHPAFGWAWLVRFLIMCGFASGSYSTYFLMQRFGVSPAGIGAIVLGISAVTIGCIGVTSVVAGYVSDAVKRQRPFVVVAGIVASTGLVLMSIAGSIGAVFVGSSLIGLGIGTFLSVDLALCMRVLPNVEDTGRDLAIINIANSLPNSLVPFAAPALIALGGYPALFLTLAVLVLLGGIAILRVPEVGRENTPSRTAPITRI